MAADRHATALALLVLATACGGAAPGAFGPDGFCGERLGYELAYADPARRALVDPDWRVTSHYFDRKGRALGPKRGAGYEARLESDLDGDGSLEELGGPFLYDLRLEHARGAGVLFLRHVPVPTALEAAPLEAVAGALLDDFAAGRGGLAVPRGSVAPVRALDRRRVGVLGHDAVAVLVEAAPVGELSQPAPAAHVLAVVVVVRAGLAFEETSALGRRRFQALTVFGYAAPSSRFDPELAALRVLLSRFRAVER